MKGDEERRIDGKALARRIEEEVAADVERLRERKIRPKLVVVAVGEGDPSFASYQKAREKACERVGIESSVVTVFLEDGERALARTLVALSDDPSVHGILLQLPLPPGFGEDDLFSLIAPRKDVEGHHPWNAGLLAQGRPRFVPCTAWAVTEILRAEEVVTAGAHVVILGRSRVVGGPLASLLLRKGPAGNATVTVCHSHTKDLPEIVRQAEILVAAVGKPEFVKGDWLRPGVVVIDVGTHAVEDPSAKKGWRLTGDVHYPSAARVASKITPVPGGVGPVTTALLLKATVRAASGREE